jgi:multiple antibiotic resistance protein
MLAEFLSDFVTFLVVIDPIGIVPIFLAATTGMSGGDQRRVAWLATVISALVLMVFMAVGQPLLTQLGIGIPAFRVAGGIVLFLVAMKMIFEGHEDVPGEERQVSVSEVAVFPVALPAIAGPGAILTAMLLSGQGGVVRHVSVGAAVLATLAACFVCMVFATALRRVLGKTGILVVSRVMGLLLAALSAQSIIDGLKLAFQ